MEKIYEVELINQNEKGEITFSNSWNYESVYCRTMKEAFSLANKYKDDGKTQENYDYVLINCCEFAEPVKLDKNNRLADRDIECLESECVVEISLNDN